MLTTFKKEHNIKDKEFIELINKFNNVVRYTYNRVCKRIISIFEEIEPWASMKLARHESWHFL